jgi:amino acid adenylation domain-containing protein/non-ribosomal peptide synthase protein (TIGR01720 family)
MTELLPNERRSLSSVQQQLRTGQRTQGSGVLGRLQSSEVSLPAQPVTGVSHEIHTFQQTVEEQAAASLDRLALSDGEKQISYECLRRLSSQIAQRLIRELPIKPDSLVALHMPTGAEAAVAILGILKAGAAYLPLDPSWPPERIHAVLNEAQPIAVLTTIGCREAELHHMPQFQCDLVSLSAFSDPPVAVLPVQVEPENLAYVLYTSGTSGVPKGVMVTHRGLANYVGWCSSAYQMAASRGAIVHSPVTFDFTVTCLLAPLAVGTCVYFCGGDSSLEGLADALTWLDEVSVIKVTPTSIDPLWRLIQQRQILCRVHRIVVGGEALLATPQMWSIAQKLNSVIVNEYGPTECVVGSNFYEARYPDPREGPVPIGQPVANTFTPVITATGRTAGTWVAGEIYIGGWGVARGYLKRPRQTAEAFVPNFRTSTGADRLYRTGDMGRYLATDDIVYLGRHDSQIKIRGYRVDLQEVEAAIRRAPNVADCVVSGMDLDGSHQRLVAFVTPVGPDSLSISALRSFLNELLPHYMVPNVLHVVSRFPLTTNGKVDLKVLEATLTGLHEEPISSKEKPQTEVEHVLHRLWQEVLHGQDIGIDDNFFELGGDSILSIQFLARAHEAGLRLRPRDLAKYPTIRELSALASRSTPLPLVEIAPSNQKSLPLTPIQLWFFQQRFEQPDHYNQSVLLQVNKPWTLQHFEHALAKLIRHHEALRLYFVRSEDGYRQVISDQVEPQILAIDCSNLSEAELWERMRSVARETQLSIKLNCAPLLRVVFCRRGDDRNLVYIVAHHLIIDHVSWLVLLEDLRSTLEQIATNQTVAPLRHTTGYGAWAERVAKNDTRPRSIGEQHRSSSERWARVPSIPVDHLGNLAQNRVRDEASVSVKLNRTDTRKLVHDTLRAYRTRPVELLIAAYAAAFSSWSGNHVMSLDLEGHGRDTDSAGLDTSRSIGWFTTLDPVYLSVTNPDDINNLIANVKEAVRAASADSSAATLHSHSPQQYTSEVSFNFLGELDRPADSFGPLQWLPLSVAENRSLDNARPYLLEIGAYISDGELKVTFTYGSIIHETSSITALSEAFLSRLKSIIEHCAGQPTIRYTPSDFPLARLTQDTLDSIVAAHPDLEDIYPVTHVQQGMLFHATHSTSTRAYMLQLRMQLTGLDPDVFEKSWEKVFVRNTALRTSLLWTSVAEPLQIVHRDSLPSFVRMDLRGESESGKLLIIEDWAEKQMMNGLDLSKAPLHRFGLFRVGTVQFEFVWLYHHILVDGWSTSNILREVLHFYALAKGKVDGIELAPATPFRDYVAWLASKPTEDSREYWQKVMLGVTSGTSLALGKRPTPGGASRAHRDEMLYLPPETIEDLVSTARKLHVPANVIVQGAWALVLSRYARTDDVIFGVTVSGRPYELPGVENRIGLFLNTLPLRINIQCSVPVTEYLGRVHEQLLGLLQHDHVALSEVSRLCQIPEAEPLFESIVVFENFPKLTDIGVLRSDVEVSGVSSVEQTNYALTIVVGGSDTDLSVRAIFDPDRFEIREIRQILAHLGDVLTAMTTRTESCIGQLSVQWSQCISGTGARSRVAPIQVHDQSLQQLFEAQVLATPDAIAVVDDEQQLSYDALNRYANQIARRLVKLGAVPETFVAICLERSPKMVIALLAALKAGAAYIPIDRRFPAERVALLARRAGAVILDQTSRNSFSFDDIPILDLDVDTSVREEESDENLSDIISLPQQVAYLMYTSGSSGQPKGTLVTHENVTRLFRTSLKLYDFASDGIWSFFHSIAFDFSVWEIFGALLAGGRLVVTPYWVARSPHEFVELMRRERITVLSQTPSAFRELLHVGQLTKSDALISLKWIVFGGEALYVAALRDYCGDLYRNGTRLINMYGITETTVHVSHRPMDDYASVEDKSYIGQALPDLSIELLDAHLSPVPDGVAGEICVGGKGVVRGYVDAPRLTAERFVPSASAVPSGARLYRSGDLARVASNADLEYLGRNDRQVKIRGFRIELDEVLFQLRKLPFVREALVRAIEDHSGDQTLAAYIVPQSFPVSLTALRSALSCQLPDYMVPSVLHVMDSFPLTANGKIDYRALPSAAEPGGQPGRKTSIAPQTWEQEVIAEVWQDVLGVSQVSIGDSFFALGGDSIKALRIVAHLRSLGFDVSTETLFEHFTIGELSRVIPSRASVSYKSDANTDTAEPQEVHRELPNGVIDRYPATQLQLGMLFHGGEIGEQPVHYHNVCQLHLEGTFDEPRFRSAVRVIVSEHPALRTGFAFGEYDLPTQVVFSEVELPVTIIHLRNDTVAERESRIRNLVEDEKRRPFKLDLAPLIRFHVLICSDQDFYLVVTEHHAILDGWSMASLLTELFEIYTGKPDSPRVKKYDPERNSFGVYARLERNAIDSEVQMNFWTDYLKGYKPLSLPVPSNPICLGDSHPTGIKKVQANVNTPFVRRLHELSRDIQVPFKSILLAAHLAVLGFLTNQPDTITGVITHGRPEIDGSEEDLGLFLNTLPLRIKQTPISWKAWIHRVFREELQILPYRRFPLAAMRDEYGHVPQLSTAFNYTNFHIYERLPQNAEIRILEIVVDESTNFDLLTDFCLLSRTGELEVTLSYSAVRFDAAQINAVLDSYLRCLELMANSPSERMCLPLNPDDRYRHELQGAGSPLPGRWTNLCDVLGKIAELAVSDRIAVLAGDSHLSYGGLSAKVQEIVEKLNTVGFTAGSPVAVLMDKSLEWVASAVAVILAGGIYVPLDRSDPADRIKYILRDTGSSLMLTDYYDELGSSETVEKLLAISFSCPSLSKRPTTSWHAAADNLAYILYTSGSTGKPKGVAMPHGGIANLMSWQSQKMPMDETRILQYASPGFDVSVQEILTALCGGNTLVLAPLELRRDFVGLVTLLVEQQVECVFAPHTVIESLLTTARDCDLHLAALKTLVNAGEAMTVDTELSRFLDSGGRLYNHYGPTETHVVTATAIHEIGYNAKASVPIGKEIPNIHIDIIDWWGRPVLAGSIGEIYIDGPAVAHGYHRSPKLTAERFLPNGLPYAKPGSRVFRTGDLGYRDNSGVIWFQGRADSQVKLRGYRIELEEIRHVLLEYPGVTEAIVSTVGDENEKRICAFLISKSEFDANEVRSFAGTKLPTYMVPSTMIRIASCPTTRNGKIDYARLATLVVQKDSVLTERVLGIVETKLASTWKEVLKRDQDVGPGHDFLEIGGNSILLLQLQLKLQKCFGIRVPMATLVRNSSFVHMCQCVKDALHLIAVPGSMNPESAHSSLTSGNHLPVSQHFKIGPRSVS